MASGRTPRRRVHVPGSGRGFRGVGGGCQTASLANPTPLAYCTAMITRGDILWLGIASGVSGGLIGGLMLGIGLGMIVDGYFIGFIFVIPGAPISGLIGWLLARRLARQLDQG